MSTVCIIGGAVSVGAARWVAEHPDTEDSGCCYGTAMNGPEGCTCWTPVYDVDQSPPVPPATADDVLVRERACGDCAYRPGSPERAQPYEAERLLNLPTAGTPFWCHDGMRRAVTWVHPDGRTITGDPADYHPPIVGELPYRANGRPALLCAGWAARAGQDRP